MTQRKKTVTMWALYALFFLAVLLVQDAMLGRVTLWGASLMLVPAAAFAVAVHTGAEEGGLFCLIASIVWALSGAADGGLMILLLTFCGIVCGYLATSVLQSWLIPASALCLVALALTLGISYAVHIYLEELAKSGIRVYLLQVGMSLPFVPLFVWVCDRIRKVGP